MRDEIIKRADEILKQGLETRKFEVGDRVIVTNPEHREKSLEGVWEEGVYFGEKGYVVEDASAPAQFTFDPIYIYGVELDSGEVVEFYGGELEKVLNE